MGNKRGTVADRLLPKQKIHSAKADKSNSADILLIRTLKTILHNSLRANLPFWSDSDACADAYFDPDRQIAADADADACADAFTDQEGAWNKIW